MRGEYLNIVKKLSEKKIITEAEQDPKVYSNYFVGWVVSKLSIDPMALKDETIESIADEFVSEMSALVGPEIEDVELNLPELKTIVTNYTQKALETNGGEEGEEAEEKEEGSEEKNEEPKVEKKPAPKKENPFAKKEEGEKNEEEAEEENEESSAPKAPSTPKAPKSSKTECATSLTKIKAPKPVKLSSEVKGPKPYKK